MIIDSTKAPMTQNHCCTKFLLEDRKKAFVSNISKHLKGILYEKKRVVYDPHSDNFTMFIYFGKRNTCIIDAIFTLKSNYFFGSMSESEMEDYAKNDIEFQLLECKRLSEFMVQDLEQHFGKNYSKYVKLRSF